MSTNANLGPADEETPLLEGSAPPQDAQLTDSVYNRFTKAQKRTIVALIALAGLTPLFISQSFVPSIPQIARDLGTVGSVVNIAISLSVLTNAVGSLIWSAYSSYYGRKPIYILSLLIQCLGSLGVASARNVPQLLTWRVIQALGASSGMSVGMGVIADIYKREERGVASGIFHAAILLGPALAPPIGGTIVYYYSWRTLQICLCLFALTSLVLTTIFQPETSQPGARGIDKARAKGEKPGFVVLNPFKSLGLLRSPNILLPAFEGAFVLISDLLLIVPIAFTIGAKYNITNEALIGALCIPIGVGNCVGAPLAGMFSDRLLVKWRTKRGNAWVPEDRLRAALFAAGVLVPCSVLFVGLITRYVDGTLGLVLNCICLFMNGLGVDFVLSPVAAYNVDILHDRSAEVTAAVTSFRAVLISVSVTMILPAINLIGVALANAVIACVTWIGFGLLVAVVRYGDRMRAWVDLGFTTN